MDLEKGDPEQNHKGGPPERNKTKVFYKKCFNFFDTVHTALL